MKDYFSFVHRYACARALLIALLLASLGCSDSNGPATKLVLVDILPAATRGYLGLAGTADSPPEFLQMPTGQDEQPWRQNPQDILHYYSAGMDLLGNADELVLAQPTPAGDEFVLLVDIDKKTGNALLDEVDRTSAENYRGFAVALFTDTRLYFARLNSRNWIIAPRASLERVIDVLEGDHPDIHQGPVSNYLYPEQEVRAVTFVYGLAGLYGDAPTPGNGQSSLNPAIAVRATFTPRDGEAEGVMQFFTPNAEVFTQRLRGLLPEQAPPVISSGREVIDIDLAGLSPPGGMQSLLKSLYIGMNAVDYAEATQNGSKPPWLNFIVGKDPSSIFINFEFASQAKQREFEARYLPAGFRLTPLQILDTDDPRYFLVLNIYQSSGGLVGGARAEWSVFVHDPETGQPRFLVVQAAAETVSADPVNLLTLPEPVSHALEPTAIESYVGVVDDETGEEETYFSSRISWPQPPETHVHLDPEFAVANDYIFWGNAVADRGLYNSTIYGRPLVRVPDDEISLVDNSLWSAFIKPDPVHSLVYLNPLDIVISPWWNLDEDYLDVTEAHRQALKAFKNGFYPGVALTAAELALTGTGDSLAATARGETMASAYYHFPITDPQGLLLSAGAQGRFTPAAVALSDGEEPGLYLTLAITRSEGDLCDVRADWVTYVLNDQGRAMTLQLDTLASDACIDPVSQLGLSAGVAQLVESDELRIRIASAFVRFEARLVLETGREQAPGIDWVQAGEEVCSLNDVCNYAFYDGRTLNRPVNRIDYSGIFLDEIATPWNDFIDITAVQVTVRQFTSILAVNPWRNVPPFGT